MESYGCMQAMKKVGFYQFMRTKAQEEYYNMRAEEEEEEVEDVKPIIAAGKIQAARRLRGSEVTMTPRVEVEIRGNLTLKHLFPWEIKKTLTLSDVGGSGHGGVEGLWLGEEQVQNHVLRHWNNRDIKYEELFKAGGVPLVIHDLDTRTFHSLVLWKWDAFRIIYILGGSSWMEDFVTRRRLLPGTFIGLCWDIRGSFLCFSVLESPPNLFFNPFLNLQ